MSGKHFCVVWKFCVNSIQAVLHIRIASAEKIRATPNGEKLCRRLLEVFHFDYIGSKTLLCVRVCEEFSSFQEAEYSVYMKKDLCCQKLKNLLLGDLKQRAKTQENSLAQVKFELIRIFTSGNFCFIAFSPATWSKCPWVKNITFGTRLFSFK